MAERSMIDALLNQDKEYDYQMLLPFKTRRGIDPDQLSTDYMQGDLRPAVPSIIADFYNSAVKGGQMIQGEREIDPGELFMNTLDLAPGGLLAGRLAPKGAVLGANVFQGGPHKYGPEGAAKSLSHVGKGEGAQAYGWGRYDADAEGVARDYQRRMSANVITGVEPKRYGVDEPTAQKIADKWLIYKHQANDSDVAWMRQQMDPKDPADAIALDVFDGKIKRGVKGHLYKHDLPDEDIARYLDHDKPLSEQPEVFGQLKRHWDETIGDPDIIMQRMELTENSSGKDLYQALAGLGRDDKGASEALGRAGIPGLKYQDAVSRNKPLKEIKESFLTELPEDAGIDEIVELFGKGHFSPDNEAILKALAADDWLGFDSPAQAISAALGKNINNWEPSARLTKAIAKAREGGTHNYVTWDQGVLDRMKLLERNGESMIDALRENFRRGGI
jgi:hypothetical protein